MFESPDKILMSLMKLDLDPVANGTAGWNAVCDEVYRVGRSHDAFSEYESKYNRLLLAGDHKKLLAELEIDMLDNMVLGAFAAKAVGIPTTVPLLTWAAINRKQFQGWHGEISILRVLLWAGYEASIPDDDNGATPLHAMACLAYHPFTNSRAMRYLLEAGADPNHVRNNGDTPLITLCGNTRWHDDHTECFKTLVQGGAHLFVTAADGATPLSLLEEHQASHPHASRAELVEMVKAFILRMELMELTPDAKKSAAKRFAL